LLLVETFVELVGLAERLEFGSISVEIVADVGDVLLKKWQEWIWVSHISGNASWIFIAVRQASLFSLSTLGFDVAASS
jgi:hypothetical protein